MPTTPAITISCLLAAPELVAAASALVADAVLSWEANVASVCTLLKATVVVPPISTPVLSIETACPLTVASAPPSVSVTEPITASVTALPLIVAVISTALTTAPEPSVMSASFAVCVTKGPDDEAVACAGPVRLAAGLTPGHCSIHCLMVWYELSSVKSFG